MFLGMRTLARTGWTCRRHRMDPGRPWSSIPNGSNLPLMKNQIQTYCRQSRRKHSARAFFCASMTVEAAIVLPLFLAAVLTVAGYCQVYSAATRISAAMLQTAEEIAIAAYTDTYQDASPMAAASVSAAYAQAAVTARAGDTSCVRSLNFLLSSIPDDEERIDLVAAWKVRQRIGFFTLPSSWFIQRSCVRAWTGRTGSGGEGGDETDTPAAATVYVTEYGQVYHTDPDCSHIRLTIMQVPLSEVEGLRNVYGSRYHTCEKCGRASGSQVYITTDGDRYHSSLDCSGLKRTVREMTAEEAEGLRPCSKCAAGEAHEAHD